MDNAVPIEDLTTHSFSELRTSDLDLGGEVGGGSVADKETVTSNHLIPALQQLTPLLEPTAWPPQYVEGFVRPYFVAESIASGLLKVQASLAGGASGVKASSGSVTAANVGANGGLLCGAVSMARNLESVGIDTSSSRSRLTVRVSLLQCDTSEKDPLKVSPSARINPLMARRKNLFRTSAAVPDASHGGTVTWPATPSLAPELFVVDINATAPRALVAVDGTPSPLSVNAWLADWQYLKGYLLFQLFSVPETTAVAKGSASQNRGVPTLVAQSVLRLCDLFAGASLPFVAAYSGLHQVLFPNTTSPKEPAGALPPAQEFFLRLWLPLHPFGTKKPVLSTSGDAPPREPAALLATLSLVLPRGLLVPFAALVPPPLLNLGPLGEGGEGDNGSGGGGGGVISSNTLPPLPRRPSSAVKRASASKRPPLPSTVSAGSTLSAIRARRPTSAASSSSSRKYRASASDSVAGSSSFTSTAAAPPARPHLPIRRGSIDAAAALAALKPATANFMTALPILGASSLAAFTSARRSASAARNNNNNKPSTSSSSSSVIINEEDTRHLPPPPLDTSTSFSRTGSDVFASNSRPGSASSSRSRSLLSRTYGVRPSSSSSASSSMAATASLARSAAVAAPPPPPSSKEIDTEIEFISAIKHNLSGLERELTKVKVDVHRAMGSALTKKQRANRQVAVAMVVNQSSSLKTADTMSGGGGGESSRRQLAQQDPVEALRDRLADLTVRFADAVYTPDPTASLTTPRSY